MAKKFIDIDKILNTTDLNNNDLFYKELMEQIPNHNGYDEGIRMDNRVVYRKLEFIIIEVHDNKRTGYIIQNTKKKFSEGHTHVKSLDMAKNIINNVIHKKTPKTHNQYLLESHIRISNDDKYIQFLKELKNTRANKNKQDYYNPKNKK